MKKISGTSINKPEKEDLIAFLKHYLIQILLINKTLDFILVILNDGIYL